MKKILFLLIGISLIPHLVGSQSNHIPDLTPGSGKSEKEDILYRQKSRSLHGVYLEALGKNPLWYSMGYEWTKKFPKKHGAGVTTGIGFNPIKKRFLNLHLGVGGFYEYGNQFGFRIGSYLGYNTTPIMYTDALHETMVYSDMPYIHAVSLVPNLSFFYRTKNDNWQFLLSGVTYWEATQIRTSDFSVKWLSNPPFSTIFPGITVKYHFKIVEE